MNPVPPSAKPVPSERTHHGDTVVDEYAWLTDPKDPETIARQLASKKVSPKGPGSGMRMLTYFINRAGKGLSKSRLAELERAKKLLSKRVKAAREKAKYASA